MKKFIAVALCIAMIIISSSNTIFMVEADNQIKNYNDLYLEELSLEYPDYVRVMKNIQQRVADGTINIEQACVFDSLNDDELEIIADYHRTLFLEDYNLSSSISFFNFSEEEQNQINQIEELAKTYYTYYENYGYFPDIDNKSNSMENGLATNYNSVVNSASVASDVEILAELGYYFNVQQVASQLAQIGAAIYAGGAVGFHVLLSILLGAAVIGAVTAIILIYWYSAIAVVNNWYLNSLNSQILTQAQAQSKAQTEAIENAKAQQRSFLLAYLNTGSYGGIFIGSPIDDVTAANVILNDSDSYGAPQVFAISGGAANYITSRAATMQTPPADGLGRNLRHDAHSVDSYGRPKPLNLPHWHADFSQMWHGLTHCFYPGI